MNIISKSFFFDKEELILNLKISRMNVYYRDFVNNSLRVSIMIDVIINVVIFFIIATVVRSSKNYALFILLPFSLLAGFVILYRFFLRTPQVKIIRSRKNIDAEIISAIRFLILDLKANAPIFDALHNIAKNFDEIGRYLTDVIVKVKLGSGLLESLDEISEMVPSEEFRAMLWQIINHLQTGTDITHPLKQLADEIVEKQKIAFKKYGKKLNVLSLFYMIVAIILPTIGFTIVSAALIFIGFKMTIGVILGFWLLFTVMQLMFLAMSSGNRPVVEQ